MIWFLAFFLGIVLGMLLTMRLTPLLFERIRALALLPVLLVVCLLPYLIDLIRPGLLWTNDRALLITLTALAHLLALFLITLNVLPDRARSASKRPVRVYAVNKPPVRWYHRTALLIVAAGLIANALVLLLNRVYMPIPESYLADLSDPATAVAIRNQALLLKRLIDENTLLPWLGQVWRLKLLTEFRLSVFPYISPGEVITAIGLFLTGITQFFGDRRRVAV
jgi:hypothetical protein